MQLEQRLPYLNLQKSEEFLSFSFSFFIMPSDLNSEERRHGRASQLEWSKSLYELTNYAVKSVLHLKKMVDPDETLKYWAYFALCVTSISFDFLVFYIPVIDDDEKCLELDTQLGAKAILLRSFFDVFLTVIFFLERFSDSYDPTPARYGREKPSHITSIFFGYLSLFDLLLVLPLPQLLIWNITSNMMRLKFWDAMKLLKFCVFLQDVPRVIRIYPLFTKAIKTSENHAEATWVKAAFTFLLYMLAAHAFGAIWYLTAIEKETECWEKAYTNQTGCSQLGSFYCGSSSRNYTFLDGFCPTKTRNTAVYDFGMFHDALQSGIVELHSRRGQFMRPSSLPY
ncbi:hypothetical protein Pint_17692 [Pistacia integerrima]|uniref:Uncharacterized protein n=1 Tax=Pistacia integerrima TaxID=434235 RepID=A0ACC0YZN3_9ROSI|nr:hypothetical protein Pint_17692 [Pistacia integerrima]